MSLPHGANCGKALPPVGAGGPVWTCAAAFGYNRSIDRVLPRWWNW